MTFMNSQQAIEKTLLDYYTKQLIDERLLELFREPQQSEVQDAAPLGQSIVLKALDGSMWVVWAVGQFQPYYHIAVQKAFNWLDPSRTTYAKRTFLYCGSTDEDGLPVFIEQP